MRLFVAINLPADVRHSAHGAMAPLRDPLGRTVSWVRADNLHVTVQFLGDVAPARVSAIADAVRAAARATPTTVARLGGVGAFPSLARPRILWIGIEPNPALDALYHAVTDATGRLGFERERRPYHPHVTIGRVRVGATTTTKLAAAVESVDWTAVVSVHAVDLMVSEIGAGGARYRVAASCPLGTTPMEV